ncbi:acetylserotonin O-methyltransferase [Amycolatopsis sp. WQ 127309]|uniref:acetylserotonin O-methyltransferase n=1 Tax=Amycolatopsis sp. WQ 127309 TaxID=2932773 RepID=UPI001FF6376A|nr:acetylserotonin O-methyltransferase [Amycolatopsis sp. WQ 127309]UOZ11595.1 acetylserotonin O-methyltransferase [Amycolatopsis sp. WQ 127309]
MRTMLYGQLISRGLVAVAELGIAELLAPGPRTVRDIAGELGTHEQATRRLLEGLTTFGVFESTGDDAYGLTGLGTALCADTPGTAAPTALLLGLGVGQAWAELTSAVRTGKSAFAEVFGEPFFDHLTDGEEIRAIFHRSQAAAVTAELAGLAEHVTQGGYRRLVDVGGGDGTVLCAILARSESAGGIVFDAPAVAAQAASTIARAQLTGRCNAQGGDFFDQVPAGGDLYLLSRVVHDWSDEDVTRILGTCRAAMGGDATLMIVDYVLGDGAERMGAIMDLYMMSLFGADGGRERTLAEFTRLLEGAGFTLTGHRTLDSGMGVLEARPAIGTGESTP